MSMLVPYMITQEPILKLQIVLPEPGTELVAPLSVTFSTEEALGILRRRGMKAVSLRWDFDGDGEVNEETVTPTATAYFDRQGGYNIVVDILLNNGDTRTLRRRLVIPNAVFSHNPVLPIVDDPVQFSIAHLVPEDVKLREVQWDFDADGIPDYTGTDLSVVHTFLRTGPQEVTVVILFDNQTQQTFYRTLDIGAPAPLPFPVTIDTTPSFLEGPPPFQIVFSVNTEEPLQEVVWDFADGTREVGDRLGHTFDARGTYQVRAEARNLDGEIARVTKVVRVVNSLKIPDLSFEGSHPVENNRITAQTPVVISLTPKTSLPLVNFFWEAPNASEVHSTDTKFSATYRKDGTYTAVLVGQDAEGAVLRLPITIEVQPKSDSVLFDMEPTQGVAPLSVQFDASESYIPNEEITGFVWDFGDSKEPLQRLDSAKVKHLYKKPGNYTVTLTVYTTIGNSFSVSKTILVRAPLLDACFTVSRTEGEAPLGVRFDRSCTAGVPAKILWDFDDGSQSEDIAEVVNHVFEEPRRAYTVRLRAEDANGIISTYELPIRTK